MHRQLSLLLLLILVSYASAQPEGPTVIVLDQSYSMSLSAGGDASRSDLLIDSLSTLVGTSGGEANYALVAFEDPATIRVVTPYPASYEKILQDARTLTPWGRSPVLAATRFAIAYASGLVGGNRQVGSESSESGPVDSPAFTVIVVTDGEDDSAYLRRPSEEHVPMPAALAGDAGSGRLSIITLGGEHPGSTPMLSRWATDSGGEVITVDRNGAGTAHGATDMPPDTRHEADSVGPRTVAPTDTGRPTLLARVVASWMMVFRWNMAIAALAGAVAAGLALRTHLLRVQRAERHNALPTKIVLEIRTTLTTQQYTLTSFPLTLGRTARSTLKLEGAPNHSISLNLTAEGLSVSSHAAVTVNGVPRKQWTLNEGDMVRFGKYRITFVSRNVPEHLPRPAVTWWRVLLLPAFALAAAVLLFAFRPFETLSAASPVAAVNRGDPHSGSPYGHASQPAGPTSENMPSAASIENRPLPPVYSRDDAIPFFDADYVAIHAHPDDESLDFGVLLARMHAAGLKGVVILLTDGDSGRDQYPERETGGIYPAYDLSGSALVSVRVNEARHAMAHLGVDLYLRASLPNFPYNGVADELPVSQVLNRWGGLNEISQAVADVVGGFTPEIVISPDVPRGPYEHFEHEATGVIAATMLEILRRSGASPVRAHLVSVDPLQRFYYDQLIAISPWEIDPVSGLSFRALQLRALEEHRTQRDSSVVGVETRLAAPAEYYAVDYWDTGFTVPEEVGIDASSERLAAMALPSGK